MKIMKELSKTHIQLIILFGTLVLYLLIKDINDAIGIALGMIIAIEIFLMVGLEIKAGAKEYGWEHEVIDTLVALLVAVAIWISASVMLNTSSPISGVVSCSMLPNLYRGDFVILQGADIDAYEIKMSKSEFSNLSSHTSVISYNGTNKTIKGSAYSYCMLHRYEDICKGFINNPEQLTEVGGPFTYHYSKCKIDYSKDNIRSFGPCLRSVEFEEKEYLVNYSNNIIVYESDPGNLFYSVGDIVHRVLFKIKVANETYYVTRGDNNPIMDTQMYIGNLGNSPIPERNVKGKVLFRIPLLGYFKLFIAGFYKEDSQCNMLLNYDHV
jgi:signal peptidase I